MNRDDKDVNRARDVIERSIDRERNGNGNIYPRYTKRANSHEELIESKDAFYLYRWGRGVLGIGSYYLPCEQVQDMLNERFGDRWRLPQQRRCSYAYGHNNGNGDDRYGRRDQEYESRDPRSYYYDDREYYRSDPLRMTRGAIHPELQSIIDRYFGNQWREIHVV